MTIARFAIQTPPAPGAIGVIALCSDRLDDALRALGIGDLGVGRVALRDLLGVDRGLVARWSLTRADLTPHAGVGVIRRLREALIERGCVEDPLDPLARYPEAQSLIEARMLAALSQAPCERAIDLLLDQPGRWAGLDDDASDERLVPGFHLRRLLEPALIVIAGAPNIGKSTLLNTLAGQRVSIVADQRGTTRDHVGVTLELDGLCVRALDLPGLDEDAQGADARAAELALRVARTADLALLCGDARTPPPTPEALSLSPERVIRVGLRADLGRASWGADHTVCAPEGRGIDELARLIRRRLVPDSALLDPRPWRFWG